MKAEQDLEEMALLYMIFTGEFIRHSHISLLTICYALNNTPSTSSQNVINAIMKTRMEATSVYNFILLLLYLRLGTQKQLVKFEKPMQSLHYY